MSHSPCHTDVQNITLLLASCLLIFAAGGSGLTLWPIHWMLLVSGSSSRLAANTNYNYDANANYDTNPDYDNHTYPVHQM
jgi:hypothetical protein